MYDQDWNSKSQSPSADPVTKAIYKQCKQAYGVVYNNLKDMKAAQRKHFEAYGEFIQGYESGCIQDWRKFFTATARKIGQ